jgi:hypothetical protein
MSPLWTYFWPVFALGIALALIGGIFALRRPRKRWWVFVGGVLIAAGGTALWHGPAGAADRFARTVDSSAQQTLAYYEMSQVSAHLHRSPLTRRLMLSGEADDFQRSELVRILSGAPGVSSATWSRSAGLPLIVEAEIVTVVGFLVGLLLAYLIELRRRYNAQWKW